ncbi:MAG: alcohol dehydrogenase catalytic domain-containing protein [Desulfomonilaceae bacterium]
MKIGSLELEGPRDDEVLVRIVASGICHTDIDFCDNWDSADTPIVLGHEGAGVVEQIGKCVQGVVLGVHIVISFSDEGSVGNAEADIRQIASDSGRLTLVSNDWTAAMRCNEAGFAGISLVSLPSPPTLLPLNATSSRFPKTYLWRFWLRWVAACKPEPAP